MHLSNKIVIHPSFLFFLYLSLFTGYAIEAIIFALIIFIHEFAHLVVGSLFGVTLRQINLTGIGGIIELENTPGGIKDIIISLAGPLANGIIIIVLSIIKKRVPDSTYATLYQFNIVMIFVNLVPIYPLDGYRVLKALMLCVFDDEYTMDCMLYLSLILIAIVSILCYIFQFHLGFLIIIFLLYKILKLGNNREYYRLKKYSFLNGAIYKY